MNVQLHSHRPGDLHAQVMHNNGTTWLELGEIGDPGMNRVVMYGTLAQLQEVAATITAAVRDAVAEGPS